MNRSSYSKWLHRDVSKQEQSDKVLIHFLRTLYQESGGIFGYRRMQLNLKRRFGLYCNLKRVRRVMRAIEMSAVIRRKRPDYIRTTPEVTAENVLNREFKASAMNEKRVTDVRELKYGKNGRMYPSAIPDLKDKSIVSYNMGAKMILNWYSVRLMPQLSNTRKQNRCCIVTAAHNTPASSTGQNWINTG